MNTSTLSSSAIAFERVIRSSELHLDSLTWWLHFWTVVVVIGVAIEVFVVVREYRQNLSWYRRGWITTPEKPTLFDLAWSMAGAIAVTIGVAGELLVGINASSTESHLRIDNNKLVGLLNVRAEDARKRAESLEVESRSLKKEVEEQKTKSAEAQAALVRELRFVTPRGLALNNAIHETLPRLGKFKGQRAIIVTCAGLSGQRDPERENTIIEIWFELHQARWDVSGPIVRNCQGVGLSVWVMPKADEKTRAAARFLSHRFKEILGRFAESVVGTITREDRVLPQTDPHTVCVLVDAHFP